MSIGKGQLVDEMARKTHMPKIACKQMLDATTDLIIDHVSRGEDVQLVGFGNFSSREHAARTGRNPQTGEAITVNARKSPAFKAGKTFRDIVNGDR